MRPRILLADEPTGNLDPDTSAMVFRELLALIRHTGVAALIATHNLQLAKRMHRVLRLEERRAARDAVRPTWREAPLIGRTFCAALEKLPLYSTPLRPYFRKSERHGGFCWFEQRPGPTRLVEVP